MVTLGMTSISEKPLWPIFGILMILYSLSVGLRIAAPIGGDETRYLEYAHNLTQGTYALARNGAIRNGPGYPLLLAPFVAIGIPEPSIRYLNIPLVLLALCYIYGLIAIYTTAAIARLSIILIALYPPLIQVSGLLMSEVFSLFLFSGFCFHFLTWQRLSSGKRHFYLSALYLGLLALTKPMFGYVSVTLLVLFLLARLGPTLYRRLIRKSAMEGLLGLALVICLPYLVYTYQLTSKVFYWGTNGGENLYWMTVSGPKIWGSWMSIEDIRKNPQLASQHLAFLEDVHARPALEQDELYMAKVKAALIEHPQIYLRNWVSNVMRLWFNYPYSLRQHSLWTYGYIMPNMFLVFLLLASIYPAIKNSRSLDGVSLTLGLMALVYSGLNSLVCMTGRHLIVVLPVFVLWITYVFHRFARIQIRSSSPLSD